MKGRLNRPSSAKSALTSMAGDRAKVLRGPLDRRRQENTSRQHRKYGETSDQSCHFDAAHEPTPPLRSPTILFNTFWFQRKSENDISRLPDRGIDLNQIAVPPVARYPGMHSLRRNSSTYLDPDQGAGTGLNPIFG